MAGQGAMVELTDVRLTLSGGGGAVNVLQGVDLNVPAGQSLSVVGPSGAGKTTLLMVIGGLEKPSSGTVRVAEQDLGALDEDDLARFRRGRVGIVFQAFHLISTMTAWENVALPLEFAQIPEARQRALQALESVGLRERVTHRPGQLSGGEQQRVALARAFAAEPGLILADEPTGNLDRENGLLVMDLLFRLQERHGTTLILVTHDTTLAHRCARSVTMTDGRVDNPAGVPSCS